MGNSISGAICYRLRFAGNATIGWHNANTSGAPSRLELAAISAPRGSREGKARYRQACGFGYGRGIMAIFAYHGAIAIHGIGFADIPRDATPHDIDAIIASTSESFKAWHSGQWIRGKTIAELIDAIDNGAT